MDCIQEAVFAIMAEAGYERRGDVARFRRDGIFRRDLIYTDGDPKLDADILWAMLCALDESQLAGVIELGKEAIRQGRSGIKINRVQMRRVADALTDGHAILDFLDEEEVHNRLLQAAEDGKPPISCIYGDLSARFGPVDWQSPVMEFVANGVYAIMKEHGLHRRRWESSMPLECNIIPMPDDTYAKVEKEKCWKGEILHAMISGLDEQQLLRLIDLAEDAELYVYQPC